MCEQPNWENIIKGYSKNRHRPLPLNTIVRMYSILKGDNRSIIYEIFPLIATTNIEPKNSYLTNIVKSIMLLHYNTGDMSDLGRSLISKQTYNNLYNKKGYFHYIPSGCGSFIRDFLSSGFNKGKRFIDIGCGIGDKTLIASMLSKMECHGLEYCSNYITYVKGLYRYSYVEPDYLSNFNPNNLKVGDAFNYKKFGEFDRIYTYTPVENLDKRKKFYQHILLQLKPGTMWLEVGDFWVLEKEAKKLKLKYEVLEEENRILLIK